MISSNDNFEEEEAVQIDQIYETMKFRFIQVVNLSTHRNTQNYFV